MTQGYSQAQHQAFVQQLSNQGFEVQEPNVTIPKHFPNTVISFHPAHQPSTDIDILKKFITVNQLPQALTMQFGQKRHFYTNGHIGLYLRHPTVQLNKTLPLYVRSFNCSRQQATLFFSPDNTLTLEYDIHRKGKYQLVTQQGFWAFDGKTVTVNFNAQAPAKFLQSNIIRNTPMGPQNALMYTPIKKDHVITQLNCPYEIVFMN